MSHPVNSPGYRTWHEQRGPGPVTGSVFVALLGDLERAEAHIAALEAAARGVVHNPDLLSHVADGTIACVECALQDYGRHREHRPECTLGALARVLEDA
jgi:uncharacterized protein with PIN domain